VTIDRVLLPCSIRRQQLAALATTLALLTGLWANWPIATPGTLNCPL
jgi:hypothetical protein